MTHPANPAPSMTTSKISVFMAATVAPGGDVHQSPAECRAFMPVPPEFPARGKADFWNFSRPSVNWFTYGRENPVHPAVHRMA
jgi:hypothetical protein